ncbi:histone-lysine N-methyltransferase PRDM16 [Anthonomus grandis grandis]|uniref:histone-lysine N-methyltransferase PRDM16 n=1 Tax=Anthonomus grandis grandis TaxID=2921223 RepID=UPI002164F07C|nr:histone-lysine N-methyltransferase PRDM16 [Anthonomus grandis grandis]
MESTISGFQGTIGAVAANDWVASLLPSSPVKSSMAMENLNGIADKVTGGFADVGELMVPGRVIAAGAIPQHAMTVGIDSGMLRGRVDVQQISAEVNSCGTLDIDAASKTLWSQSAHWVRAIRLANDCHSYNVQLKFQPSYRVYSAVKGGLQSKLILQAVRPIEAGQELLLWFSEDILALLQVVFLKPSNIQDQKKYRCTLCAAMYESPNPLKLHITLACGKLPTLALWERLAGLMKGSQNGRNLTSPHVIDFDFKLNPNVQPAKEKTALDLSLAALPSGDFTTTTEKNWIHRPYSECSAFKPFKQQTFPELTSNKPTLIDPLIIHDYPVSWPVLPALESDVVQIHRNLLQNQTLANSRNVYGDNAQIESLVSSLGKAKQGHICLYCGKCYSRKYGLKIHIRTHTGYKPLRCKFCNRPFGDPSNLNKHVRLHAEGNTPYKCNLCGKILVRRRDLERHLKSRHVLEMHPGQNIITEPSESVESIDSKDANIIELEEIDITDNELDGKTIN